MAEPIFADPEKFNTGFGKDKMSFKIIVLLHLKKIGEYSSVEFRGGYSEEIITHLPGGNQQKIITTYIPDSREVYSNAIEYLRNILYPHFDEEMKTDSDKADEDTEEEYKINTAEEGKGRRGFKDIEDRQRFRNEKVKIYSLLFRSLCCFLKRQSYLEMGEMED